MGVGTVIADDPQLTVRLPPGERPPARPPLRVVLDGHLRTPPRARLLRQGPTSPPPLLVTAAPEGLNLSSAERRTASTGASRRCGGPAPSCWSCPLRRDGRIPLPRVLAALATRAVQSLLVEGGSQVHGAFIAQRLVDEVAVFLAPRLQGDGVPLDRRSGAALGLPAAAGAIKCRVAVG